jgi:hypothetical protein
MLQKELEWKIRAIVERIDEILNDPDTPFHIKEMVEDIKEMASAIQEGVERNSIHAGRK